MGYKTVEVREIAIQHRVNGAAIAAAVAVLREILGLASCLPLGTAIEIQSLFMFSLLAEEALFGFSSAEGRHKKEYLRDGSVHYTTYILSF